MKYKLIQTYPGYETLGKIEDSENGHTTGWQGTIFYDAHPEYWQKVEEVDYEITEVKYATDIRFLDRGLYRIFNDGVGFELDYLLKNGGTIHSVKRLSDGEVFTIGDVLKYKSFGIKKTTIDRFDVLDRSVFAFGNNYGTKIIAAEKVKTPLFTTEDGVDVFEKDFKNHANIFSVSKSNFNINKNTLGLTVFTDDYLKFSTKEKAEEYILMNKPCLSLNETKKLFKTSSILKFEQKLIELAKSKL